jgi:hypothetical protein
MNGTAKEGKEFFFFGISSKYYEAAYMMDPILVNLNFI